MNNSDELQCSDCFETSYFIPPGPYLLRAGAAGAVIAGGWTAFSDVLRVRDQEIASTDAIYHTIRNAALGAGAGVLIGAAAHFARTHPLTSVATVLAVGAGALYLAGRNQGDREPAAQTASETNVNA